MKKEMPHKNHLVSKMRSQHRRKSSHFTAMKIEEGNDTKGSLKKHTI